MQGSARETFGTVDGVRVTTPLRTLIDVIPEGVIAQEHRGRLSAKAAAARPDRAAATRDSARQHPSTTTDRQHSAAGA